MTMATPDVQEPQPQPEEEIQRQEEPINRTNPFETLEVDDSNRNTATTTTETTADDDDDQSVQSAASAALRSDFIRLTTQSLAGSDNDDDDDEHAGLTTTARSHRSTHTSTTNGSSLATTGTTPRCLLVVLPLCCLVAHGLFVIGQTAPMWRLSLTAEDIYVWANATSGKSEFAFSSLNLNHSNFYQMERNTTVKEFTYGIAVQELWEMQIPASRTGSTATNVSLYLPQLAALLLVLFSGIWPHVKLILLQYNWWSTRYNTSPRMARRRTRTLSWLALLGKWSLADVLTVCVMVGVLNLEWIVDPPTIKNGVADHLQHILVLVQQVWTDVEICDTFLHFDTTDCTKYGLFSAQRVKCLACKTFVDTAFDHPGWAQEQGKKLVKEIATSGGGTVRLAVKGMEGIYFFCAAVLLSVLLSVMVEWYDHQYVHNMMKDYYRRRRHHAAGAPIAAAAAAGNHALSLTISRAAHEEEEEAPAMSSLSENDSSDAGASEPLLGHHRHDHRMAAETTDDDPGFQPMEIMDPADGDSVSVFSNIIQRTANSRTYRCFQCHHIVPTVTLAFVAMAIYLPSMERFVGGAIPTLLKDILGVHLDKTYSLQTLRDTCGNAGGMDLLLMATFGLFCVLGPLVRAFLVVLVAMTATSRRNSTRRIRSLLVRASNFLAAFCAWEVFLVAMIMVELLMPSITKTILNSPPCQVLSGDGSSCLEVRFERVPATFACLVLGFIMVGLLAIHVSLEDQKELIMLESGGVVAAAAGATPRRHHRSPPPDDIEADGQYYVEVSNQEDMDGNGNDDDDDAGVNRSASGNNNDNPIITTMIQHEAI